MQIYCTIIFDRITDTSTKKKNHRMQTFSFPLNIDLNLLGCLWNLLLSMCWRTPTFLSANQFLRVSRGGSVLCKKNKKQKPSPEERALLSKVSFVYLLRKQSRQSNSLLIVYTELMFTCFQAGFFRGRDVLTNQVLGSAWQENMWCQTRNAPPVHINLSLPFSLCGH